MLKMMLVAALLVLAAADSSDADKLTCEECTLLAETVCQIGETEFAIKQTTNLVKEDVCAIMPADFECDKSFESYWHAIMMAWTNPADGYWAPTHMCKDLYECSSLRIQPQPRELTCQLCAQALGYHMILASDQAMIMEMNEAGICTFLSHDYAECMDYVNMIIPVALHELKKVPWTHTVCKYVMGCTDQ